MAVLTGGWGVGGRDQGVRTRLPFSMHGLKKSLDAHSITWRGEMETMWGNPAGALTAECPKLGSETEAIPRLGPSVPRAACATLYAATTPTASSITTRI
ncbi:hypothetical protein SCUP515_09059 [Seiridium cupressi]